MSRRLGDVVRNAIQRGRHQPEADGDRQSEFIGPCSLPLLPQPRPRQLTPRSSQELLVQRCFLFAKLPAEIRRHILILAFGNRTLHLNLSNEYPVIGGKSQFKKRGEALRVNDDLPKRWTWGGCVCRRNHHPAASLRAEEWTGYWLGPWMDKCVDARVKHSLEPRSQWPSKYQIGAMGWLLSCRQAYLEGIDVLYRTNMMHIQGRVLISAVANLLLPQRLAGISYLELNLRLGFDRDADRPELHGFESDAISALDSILCSMPALKRVILSVRSDNNLGWPWSPKIYMGIVKSVDAFCRKVLDSDVNLEVPLTLALPSAAVLSIKDEANWLATELDTTRPFLLWRNLESEDEVTQMRYSTYPMAPRSQPTYHEFQMSTSLSIGYWMMEGSRVGSSATIPRHQGVFYPAFDISNESARRDIEV